MQEDHTSSTFQLGRDDEAPDAIMQSELQELKIEKLSQRVMLLTILIPCMIGIIVIISYLDIKDRVNRTQDTGAIGVQKLSKDLESKFSSLSLEQAKLKDVQTKKLPDLEKNNAYLQTRLKKVQESIKALESSKIERDELSRAVETLNEKYAAVPETLQSDMETFRITDDEIKTEADAMASQLGKVENQLGNMAETVNVLSEKLTQMQSELSNDVTAKIDKNELELALKLKEIAYRQELLEATGSLEKKIKTLQQQIDALKKANAKSTAAQPKPAETEKKPEAQDTGTKPAPGSIEEQNIE